MTIDNQTSKTLSVAEKKRLNPMSEDLRKEKDALYTKANEFLAAHAGEYAVDVQLDGGAMTYSSRQYVSLGKTVSVPWNNGFRAGTVIRIENWSFPRVLGYMEKTTWFPKDLKQLPKQELTEEELEKSVTKFLSVNGDGYETVVAMPGGSLQVFSLREPVQVNALILVPSESSKEPFCVAQVRICRPWSAARAKELVAAGGVQTLSECRLAPGVLEPEVK